MNQFFGITKLREGRTRLITAENVYGEKGRGGMAVPGEVQPEVERIGQQASMSRASRELGRTYKVRASIDLAPGSVTTLMDVDGPATITHIWITVDPQSYRDIILRMYWDGEETPSVEVPLGDFFCCGWEKWKPVNAIPINVNPSGGLNCFFPMPFREHARITVENLSPKEREGFFYAISHELGEVEAEEGYFHAQFRRSNPLEYGKDHVIVDGVKGRGHYVGTYISWQQNNDDWWGEGEVKAYIDGDKDFPTYCGTGTEDYFGGAWCFLQNFSAPFLGYCDTTAEEGHKTNTTGNRHSMYRFHIMDPIRFQEDLKVTIQALGWRSEGRFLPLRDDISSVAYWYQAEPHGAFPECKSRNELEII